MHSINVVGMTGKGETVFSETINGKTKTSVVNLVEQNSAENEKT